MWKLKHQGKYRHHKMISEFAGNVLALQLNVDFSRVSLMRYGLGALRVASGLLAGQTVNQVLALGNSVLGGGPVPTGLRISDINEVIERINKNYEAGTTDKHYLIPGS